MRLEKKDRIADVDIVGMEALTSGQVVETETKKDGSRVVVVEPMGLSPMKGEVMEMVRSRDAFTIKVDPGNGQYRNVRFPKTSKALVAEGDKVKRGDEIVTLPKSYMKPVRHHVPPERVLGVRKGQKVLHHQSLTRQDKVLLVTGQGYGKLMETQHVRFTHRGGKGVKVFSLETPSGKKRKGVGHLARCRALGSEKEVGIATASGKLYKTTIEEISTQKRYARGVVVIRLKEGDAVADLAVV